VPLAEISLSGTYTFSSAALRGAVAAVGAGTFGRLVWVVERSLDQGAAAFADLDGGSSGAAKILLRPN
jgi:alcohol dehydrogenase